MEKDIVIVCWWPFSIIVLMSYNDIRASCAALPPLNLTFDEKTKLKCLRTLSYVSCTESVGYFVKSSCAHLPQSTHTVSLL